MQVDKPYGLRATSCKVAVLMPPYIINLDKKKGKKLLQAMQAFLDKLIKKVVK